MLVSRFVNDYTIEEQLNFDKSSLFVYLINRKKKRKKKNKDKKKKEKMKEKEKSSKKEKKEKYFYFKLINICQY